MRLRIRKHRALTTGNLMVGTFLGVLSGIYMWNTPIKNYIREEEQKKQELDKTQQVKAVKD